MSEGAAGSYRIERCVVDLTRRTVERDGQAVALRPRSFSALTLLLLHPGEVVSREQFLETVWAGLQVGDESLSRCISDIRAALDDRRQRIVKTVPGRGYVLAVPIEPVQGNGAVPGHPAASSHAPGSAPGQPSIAVLPFANLSGRSDEHFLADGFTEDITSALSRIQGFVVIARSTMYAYKGPAVDLGALARELGVRYVLEGSVRKLGQRLRVNVQLVEAERGRGGQHLWAERYDREIDELFAIQEDIALRIAGRIGPELLAAEFARVRRKPPHSLSAWECVIRALHHSTQQSREETRIALDLLEQAIGHEPEHAQALGMMAWLRVFRAFQGWEEMPLALASAETLVARALAIDNDELWSYLAQGMVAFATRDNVRAVAALERAVAISPSSVNAHGLLGIAHAFGGRARAAFDEIAQAKRLSPRDTYLSDFDLYAAFTHFQAGDYAAALRDAEQAIRLRPGHPYPLILAAASAGHLGRIDAARAHVQRLLGLVPVACGAWVDATSPYVLSEDRRRLVDGLERAGLPPTGPPTLGDA